MTIWKFGFDRDICVGCTACEVACKTANEVPRGTRRRRVITVERGEYPAVEKYFVSMGCMHCTIPACERACPVKAIFKREDGVVLHDKDKCIGCGYCGWACPFGAPQYPHDLPSDLKEYEGIMDKCTFCVVPFKQEKDAIGAIIQSEPKPSCATSCTTKALNAGDVREMTKQERAARSLIEVQV